jgi:serine/threonine protein kinase
MKRRPLSDPSTGSASKRCASGGSSAVFMSAGSRTGSSQMSDFGRSDSLSPNIQPTRGSGDRTDAPRTSERRTRRQQLIGDEKLDEAQGNLDDQIFMGNWEHIGPPGTYADGVYKGLQRSNNAEVAVKVVSLLNPHIMNSEWVRAKLAEYHKPTEQQKLKVYEEKVLLEMYNTQTLSSKHICFFVGYFKESSSYSDKVIKNPSHKIRQYFEIETDRPYPTHYVFFVMENLSGGDLFEYNASARFGCGFLLAFEATPLVTEDVVHDALGQFPPFLPASDAPSESVELKKSVDLRKTYKDYLYLDTPFVHLQKGKAGDAKFLVLKFNTNFKKDFIKYMSPDTAPNRGMEMLAAEMQKFLSHEKLICCTAPVKPLPLFFDQTFIRTTLTQIMIALSHAHGSSLYHNDLKPDNIMFKERVHAHSSHASKICAKIIDWGCGGFSKDNENHHHPFKPVGEPTGKEVDMFCVGNTLLFLFNGDWERELHKTNFWTKGTILPGFFCQRTFKCPWNKSPDCQDIDAGLCVPWNPNEDVHFKELVKSMLEPDPEKRVSVKDVLRHRWMKAPRRAEIAQTGEDNPHIKKLNDLLYDFAPPHLKHMHDSSLVDGPNEETRFLDLIKSSDLPNIRRALEVLVMLPLLVKVHYAQGFIASNLVAVLSKFVIDYMYNNEYPQRHLPRTMVLLSQLASHQNTEILSQIFKTKYHGKEHQGHDSDAGRPLLDLIAYGVFDCHDPDPNHKACSLYTMLMLIALSSPTDDPDQSSCAYLQVITSHVFVLTHFLQIQNAGRREIPPRQKHKAP